jgi:hypothetical protein
MIPLRKIFGRRIMAEDALLQMQDPKEDNFMFQLVNFHEDYMRNNPVISKKSWEDWLKSIESKDYVDTRGLEVSQTLAAKYYSVISQSGITSYANKSISLESSAKNFINPRHSGLIGSPNGYTNARISVSPMRPTFRNEDLSAEDPAYINYPSLNPFEGPANQYNPSQPNPYNPNQPNPYAIPPSHVSSGFVPPGYNRNPGEY